MYFPPCLPGVSHKEKLLFKNNSRIPIEYNVDIPEKYRNEVITEPFVGNLHPFQSAKITVNFTP